MSWFLIAASVALLLGLWMLWRRREVQAQRRQVEAQVEAWRASQPPIVEPDAVKLEALRSALPSLSRQAVLLRADASRPIEAAGTRLGGPVWLPAGTNWPSGDDGRPLEFVAQVDFSTLPELPDFPAVGLMQLFIGRDDAHGADFDQPARGNFRLLFHPEGARGPGALHPAPRLASHGDPQDDGYNATPFSDSVVRETGIPLTGEAVDVPPRPYDWPVHQLCRTLGIDVRARAVAPVLEALESEEPHGHYIGGHPAFVQWDYRDVDDARPVEAGPVEAGKVGSPEFSDVDVLLLQLTSDNGLQWGDVGEANVMIRRQDLCDRRFDRAIWWWDCS